MSSVHDNSITVTSNNPVSGDTTIRQALAGGYGYEIPAGVTTETITAKFAAIGNVTNDELYFFHNGNIISATATVVSSDGATTTTFDQPVS